MGQALQSNKEDTENAIAEIGTLTETIEEMKVKANALNTQINMLNYLNESLKKQIKNETIFGEVAMPVCFVAAVIPTFFISDENLRRGMFFTEVGVFAATEISFNVGHFIIKIW